MNYFSKLSETLKKYHDIPEHELNKICELFYPCKLQKGEFFIQCGFLSDTVGFIVSGLLRYYYIDKNGIEYTKAFAAENDFAVSYASMLLKQPSPFSIQALENTLLLCIKYTDLEKIMNSSLCWCILARKVIEKVYIQKQKREKELLLDDAQTRYINFIKQHPSFHKRIKQHYIASYLGISPVSLSRIRKNMFNN
jgi:CRP-like cAMP-binding protein